MATETEPTPPGRRWGAAPLFIVDDVQASADFYRDQLGFRYEHLWGEPPSFAMVYRAGVTIMLKQLGPSGQARPNSTVDPEGELWDAYIWVGDADSLFDDFRAKGVKIARDVCDQSYGCRDFEIEDCNGYRLCFGHVLEA